MTNNAKLQPPRRCDGPAMLIAGLGEYHTFQDLSGLPAQWQRFRTLHVPKRIGSVAYGVCYNTDDNGFDYIAGVEVSDFGSIPPEFARAKLNPQHYAVFSHPSHVSTVHETFMAIFREWFPNAGEQPAAAPVFERFDERFNGQTGLGGFEIWVPLKA